MRIAHNTAANVSGPVGRSSSRYTRSRHPRVWVEAGCRKSDPTYRSWQMMRNRCNNPKARDFKHYGGRGIIICERWSDYDAFLSDMGERPHGLTLERRDVNGGYTPENCYWADRKMQARNRNYVQPVFGRYAWEWAEHLGIKHATFHHRLWKYRKGMITKGGLLAPGR